MPSYFFKKHGAPQLLPSSPTRRSSDLKPKLRKAQRGNSSGVHQVNYPATINAITGETIRMPCQNAEWFFARFNHRKHFGKFFSTGLLCAFRFGKFPYNLNAFSLGKFA